MMGFFKFLFCKTLFFSKETISVTNPGFYANRFTSYISTIVFRRVQGIFFNKLEFC